MNIVVTGATGFAGGWILRELTNHYGNEAVTGTGRNEERVKELRSEGFQMIQGDLRDERFVATRLEGFTHVVHCAAKSSIWGPYQEFFSHNVLATRNVLGHISSMEKLVHLSTPSIYFNFKNRFDLREDAELPGKFVNNYTTTKFQAEQEILNTQNEGLTTIILRPRAILGAGDTVILPRVIRAYDSGRLKIIGDGKTIADFTSARNLAHAVHLALEAEPSLNGEVFNITDGQPLEFWPLLVETIQKLGHDQELGKVPYGLVYLLAAMNELSSRVLKKSEPALTRYGVGIMKYSLTMNIDKAIKLLHYKPVVTTIQSLDEFINWYQN
ncbi:MAG: NAD-dependent epimerase/dehydratase family protein [Bacteroidota bacterium]